MTKTRRLITGGVSRDMHDAYLNAVLDGLIDPNDMSERDFLKLYFETHERNDTKNMNGDEAEFIDSYRQAVEATKNLMRGRK